jgi:tetratricopeptide (TPR) repeat protein
MSDRLAKLTKLLELDPSDAFVLYGIAQEHAKGGRVEEAVAFFDRCLAADPAYCYAYFHKAQALGAAGRRAEALAAANAGIRAAKAARDAKALSELQGLADSL